MVMSNKISRLLIVNPSTRSVYIPKDHVIRIYEPFEPNTLFSYFNTNAKILLGLEMAAATNRPEPVNTPALTMTGAIAIVMKDAITGRDSGPTPLPRLERHDPGRHTLM